MEKMNDMKTVQVSPAYLERMLNEGLNVLISAHGVEEGDRIKMVETTPFGDWTGRNFFARAMHVPDPGIVQVTILNYMEAHNPETDKVERLPMAGTFPNEKREVPEGAPSAFALEVTGERPLWLYKGVKWLAEISLVKLLFDGFVSQVVPQTLHVKVQAQDGEKRFAYRLEGEVLP